MVLLSLSVPGLAEKRPSVLVGKLGSYRLRKRVILILSIPCLGDRILVQQQGAIDGRWYEGHVHVLRQAEVGLCFHGSFDRQPEGQRFHVRFKLNRIPLQRQHQALDSAFVEDRVLFPLPVHLEPVPIATQPGPIATPSTTSIRLYNNLISGNPPQLQAVTSIRNLAPGSPPFVLFGPYVLRPVSFLLLGINAIVLSVAPAQGKPSQSLRLYSNYCSTTLTRRSLLVLQATPLLTSLRHVYVYRTRPLVIRV